MLAGVPKRRPPVTASPRAGQADPGQPGVLEGGPAEHDQGVDDDGEHHRGHPIEQVGGHRGAAIAVIEHGQAEDDGKGRGDEAAPGGDQPSPAGPTQAQVDGQLGGAGPGQQVGRPDQVEELLLGDPAAAADDLGVHEGDVGGRTAKTDRAQLEEHPGDLAQATPPGVGVAVLACRHAGHAGRPAPNRQWPSPRTVAEPTGQDPPRTHPSSWQERCPRFVNNAVTEKCVAKRGGRTSGAHIQPKGMTACFRCAVSDARNTL